MASTTKTKSKRSRTAKPSASTNKSLKEEVRDEWEEVNAEVVHQAPRETPDPLQRPVCTETTRSGAPCKAYPITGTDKCLAHSSPDTRASVGFVPEAGLKGGRPKLPREIDVVQRVFERREKQVEKVLDDGLKATKAIVVGNGPQAYVEMVPDNEHRLKVVKEMLDRLVGRARQTSESRTQNENLNVNLDLKDQAAREKLHDLLRLRPAEQDR